jgi:DUF4097 and DUF4098 domain-containing protein YvlB
MRHLRFVLASLAALLFAAGALAFGQANGGWQKSYPVSGKASLTISTGDASVEVRSCAGCSDVRIQVDWRDRKPDDFIVTEFQTGNHVSFEMKEKSHFGVHIMTGHFREPQVTVDTPAALDLEARTSDGGLKISGVQGTLELHTSDGGVDVSDVGGSLRLTASDGSIRIHNVTGTLESRSSDGHATIDGRFTALQVHTSDGNLDLTLADGTQLNTSSRIETSDGRVTVKLPREMAVDLDVHTSDGNIKCDLPLTMEGYDSTHSSGHNLRGHLNAGGVPLAIHTSDGSVTIAAL